MTLINVHVKDEEKKRLQEFVEKHVDTSMSEYIRKIISEKLRIEEFAAKHPVVGPPEIPAYIPKNKYVVFVNGAIVAIGNNPSDLAQEAIQKFPDFPFVIKYNGPPQKPKEYVYMSLNEFHGWKYSEFQDHTYPIIPLELQSNGKQVILNASLDTAATLCVLKTNVLSAEECAVSREEIISTAAGELNAIIYSGRVKILDATFKIEFIMAPIADVVPFKFLVGRNLLDQLDAYFLGRKQLILLKIAE